jgi:hypothetical protein
MRRDIAGTDESFGAKRPPPVMIPDPTQPTRPFSGTGSARISLCHNRLRYVVNFLFSLAVTS